MTFQKAVGIVFDIGILTIVVLIAVSLFTTLITSIMANPLFASVIVAIGIYLYNHHDKKEAEEE